MNTTELTLTSHARVATESAPRYLGQLCKHFTHRLPATWSEDYSSGRLEFDFGVCELTAAGGQLAMTASAASEENLERLQNVVGRHLERFMFREPASIGWTRQG
jgi:uncharacterized protein